MHITVQRGGGFAGLTEQIGSLDTAALDPGTGQPIERLIHDLAFFDLPARVSGGAVGADMYVYEVIVNEDGRQHAVVFPDDNSPETAALRHLVDVVVSLSGRTH